MGAIRSAAGALGLIGAAAVLAHCKTERFDFDAESERVLVATAPPDARWIDRGVVTTQNLSVTREWSFASSLTWAGYAAWARERIGADYVCDAATDEHLRCTRTLPGDVLEIDLAPTTTNGVLHGRLEGMPR